MPTDLPAAALIALLRERPGCCKALGIKLDIGQRWTSASDGRGVWFSDIDVTGHDRSEHYQTPRFRRWLTGAAVEKHVELGIGLPDDREQAWLTNHDYMTKKDANEWTYYPTYLHALLAGLEAHAKEKSNG